MKTNHLIALLTFFILASCEDNIEEMSSSDLVRSEDISGVVYGVVFDNDSQMPIAGVSVSLYPSGQRTITGSNGQYEFYNVSPNNYIIQVQHSDYLSTATALSIKDGKTLKNDIRMNRGQNTLVVDEHEIIMSDIDSHHSLLISNVSNKPIKWNLSYDDIFDPATGNLLIYITEWEGELQPYETKELFISVTVSATLNNNYAYPIILQSGIEKIGIVIIPSDSDGKVNSKIIGRWDLYRTGHYEYGVAVSQNLTSGSQVLTFNDDMTYEQFKNYAEIWYDTAYNKVKLEDVWKLSYSTGSFTYNPMQSELFLGESFSVGYYWKVLKVTDYELILGTMDYDQDKKEGAIYFYTKDK